MSHSAELALTDNENLVLREIDSRRDAFGNRIRLLWNSQDHSVHLALKGLDLEIPPEAAAEARDHPYPLLYRRLGEEVVNKYLMPKPAAESQAA